MDGGSARTWAPRLLAVLALAVAAGLVTWLALDLGRGQERTASPAGGRLAAAEAQLAVQDWAEARAEREGYAGVEVRPGRTSVRGDRATVSLERLVTVGGGEGCRDHRGARLGLTRGPEAWRVSDLAGLRGTAGPCRCPRMPWRTSPAVAEDAAVIPPAPGLRPLTEYENVTVSRRDDLSAPAQEIALADDGRVEWSGYGAPATSASVNLYFARPERVACVELESTGPRPESMTVTMHGEGPYPPRQLTLANLPEADTGPVWSRRSLPRAPGATVTINRMHGDPAALPDLRIRFYTRSPD